MTAAQERILIELNNNLKWLRQNQSIIPTQKEWITHEEASKIIDEEKGRSKDWFHHVRTKGELQVGLDCRRIGKTWEYRRTSIIELKERLTK